MRINKHPGNWLILSGPPGGVGTVVLLLVVGTALSGGGAFFAWKVWSEAQRLGPTIACGAAALFGLGILIVGIGSALTRDRLELDPVTRSGRWTRRLLGFNVTKPVEFSFEHARRIRIEYYTDSNPHDTGSGSGEKVRAKLLITKPRKSIELDQAEIQHAPRVREIAQTVANMLDLTVEDPEPTGEPEDLDTVPVERK
jgi:hypothetical protein